MESLRHRLRSFFRCQDSEASSSSSCSWSGNGKERCALICLKKSNTCICQNLEICSRYVQSAASTVVISRCNHAIVPLTDKSRRLSPGSYSQGRRQYLLQPVHPRYALILKRQRLLCLRKSWLQLQLGQRVALH